MNYTRPSAQRRARLHLPTLASTTVMAATLLLALSTPAWAQDVERRTVRVSYADLDISQAAGRQALEQRIERAVTRICADRTQLDLSVRSQIARKCRADAIAGVQPQLAALYSRRDVIQASAEDRTPISP
jgi:UrcA family protein